MTETLKKIEVVAGEGQSIELSECPGKREVRIRINAPMEWAVIRLTREQFDALLEARYLMELKA